MLIIFGLIGVMPCVTHAQPGVERLPQSPDFLAISPPVCLTFTIEEIAVAGASAMGTSVGAGWNPADWREIDARSVPANARLNSVSCGANGLRRTEEFGGGTFIDFAISDDVSWVLTEEVLRVVDRTSPPTNPGYAYWTMLDQSLPDIEQFFTLGLAEIAPKTVEPKRLDIRGQSWRWSGRHPTDATIEFFAEGKLQPDGSLTVDRVDGLRDGKPLNSRSRIARDWRFVEPVQQWIAHDVVLEIPEASLCRRYQLISVEAITAEELVSRVTPPDPMGNDALRGSLTITGFEDLRPEHMTLGTLRGSGFEMSPSTTPTSGSARVSWRTAGWASAIALVGIIVALRIRRRNRGELN